MVCVGLYDRIILAANKRNEYERLADLVEIESLALKGKTQKEISEILSSKREYTITQQQISFDLADVRKRWQELAMQDIATVKGQELATLDLQRREAWRGWDRSREPGLVTQKEVVKGPQGTITKLTERTEQRSGEKGFLDVIADNVKARRQIFGIDAPKQETPTEPPIEIKERGELLLPSEIISKDFVDPWRDIKERAHTEYVFYGGRGSTKSSFISLAIITLIVNNPNVHALVMRQVANTLRDSVFSQLQWAIDELGLTGEFKSTTSPIEITYLKTGQKIFCRGGDEPGKLKSIRPPLGAISILWLEELDQFRGTDAVRKIEQSAMRGSDVAWIFKSWNPPRTVNAWVNQYILIPKKNQLRSFSNYLNVPRAWLGQPWLDEAEHLLATNPEAYKHEYGGIAVGLGGQVFDNVVLRPITQAEIDRFDHVGQGLDFGWFPDPLMWSRSHYDAARMKLYIFDELRANKKKNRSVYDLLVKEKKIPKNELIIGDSSEPKSIADFLEYGATIRGAEKKPDSVDYSMKWLQSLVEIVIDPVRCPYHAKEFIEYELEVDRDGNYISEYPDRNNHAIDATRYRTNLIWRLRGK